MDTAAATPTTRPDGRSTRWAAHRRTRREELVTAAMRAISQHGADVGMDEIATTAGTSKTVLYRHFSDKEDLYLAVAARVNRNVTRELRAAVNETTTPRDALAAMISTYLRRIEHDPEIYRFVVSHPSLERASTDPVQRISSEIADATSQAMTAHLRAAGLASNLVDVLAHGLIGMIRAAADRWLSTSERPGSDVLAAELTALAWGGLSAALPGHLSHLEALPASERTPHPVRATRPRTPEEQR